VEEGVISHQAITKLKPIDEHGTPASQQGDRGRCDATMDGWERQSAEQWSRL
jgi:hypothetical protein